MKPAPLKKPTTADDDDDDLHLAPRVAERIMPKTPGVAPRTPGLPARSAGGHPKTPITRSSASTIFRTPNPKTPMYTTPGRFGGNYSLENLSTPLWEAAGCLDRLEQDRKTRLEQGSMTPLSVLEQGNMTPRPPTNPASYSLDSPGRGTRDTIEIDSPISKRTARRVPS
jgi:hypothetical protein